MTGSVAGIRRRRTVARRRETPHLPPDRDFYGQTLGTYMRRLTYKLHGCALSTETKACVPLISMALPMALIAFHGMDKKITEPCLRFARALQLDFFPELRPQEVTQKLPNMV